MAKVLPFTGITSLNSNPDQVLERAVGTCEGVVVLGYDHEGNEYFDSSYADGGEVLWLLERLKKQLLEIEN